MKKKLQLLIFCMVVLTGTMMMACDHNSGTGTGTGTEEPETPTAPSIIGSWVMEKATQYTSTNDVDLTPMYGTNFTLTFVEDGTLITTQGNNTANMQWLLEDDQLSFIQAPGIAPVLYTVRLLTDEELVIENGTGTEFVTVMEFKKVLPEYDTK